MLMTALNYRELIAWQRSIALVREVYQFTKAWPASEMYGLTSQIRRAAVSVPSNIAEGQGRGPGREFVHHLNIAYGSLMELETQLYIAVEIGYASRETLHQLMLVTGEVGRLINGLKNAVSDPTTQRRWAAK
jgi:four helix bundle protein